MRIDNIKNCNDAFYYISTVKESFLADRLSVDCRLLPGITIITPEGQRS